MNIGVFLIILSLGWADAGSIFLATLLRCSYCITSFFLLISCWWMIS